MTTLCFLDTETTGLDPDRHEVWEVACIIEGEEYEWQLPVDLGRADPMGLQIGRFTERRYPAGRLSPPSDFARHFARLTEGCHLVGAVVSFDEERLRRLLRREHQCPMWHYHLVDVEALAAGWVSAKCDGEALDGGRGSLGVERSDGSVVHLDGRPPWKSDDLSRAVGVDPDKFDRHTALGDAYWAKAIYEAVMF